MQTIVLFSLLLILDFFFFWAVGLANSSYGFIIPGTSIGCKTYCEISTHPYASQISVSYKLIAEEISYLFQKDIDV